MAESQEKDDEAGKSHDVRVLLRLLGCLRNYKRYVAAALVLTVIGAPLVVAAPPLIKAVVDLYLAPDPANAPGGFTLLLKTGAEALGFGGSAMGGVAFIALVYLFANLAAMFVMYAEAVVLQRMGQFIMYDLRNRIFAHLQKLPIKFYDRNSTGDLLTRMTSDVDALNEMFTTAIISIFGDIAMILYILLWMFYVNWRLALISCVVVPPMVALTIWFKVRSRSAFRQVRTCVARINAFLQERITGMHVVQLFNKEKEEQRKFSELAAANRKANLRAAFYYATFFPAVEIVAAIGIALIIWYGGGQVIQGIATLGTVIAFVQLVEMFYEPIGDMSEKYNILQSAMAASERIFKLLDEPVEVESELERAYSDDARGRIEFRNVWFAYDEPNWILKNVSFTIEPGEKVAFVGRTGAGKTTITNLLLRFYEIQRGQILFDGVDIRELDLGQLRSRFGVVQQDVFLFSRDIASNIRLNTDSISDARLHEIGRQVNADSFIKKLPNGYTTELHEYGNGLSVGQKQLISMARALAFNPRVMIMDEATSSIDTETEFLLREAIERAMRGRTAIFVAHRLSTIQTVDKIIVMHRGEIHEVGTHRELLQLRGLYYRLYQLSCIKDDREESGKIVSLQSIGELGSNH